LLFELVCLRSLLNHDRVSFDSDHDHNALYFSGIGRRFLCDKPRGLTYTWDTLPLCVHSVQLGRTIALTLLTKTTRYARKRINKSMGTGKTTVELLSDDTSTRLCRNLRCKAAGCLAMTSAASASFCEAWNSPSA